MHTSGQSRLYPCRLQMYGSVYDSSSGQRHRLKRNPAHRIAGNRQVHRHPFFSGHHQSEGHGSLHILCQYQLWHSSVLPRFLNKEWTLHPYNMFPEGKGGCPLRLEAVIWLWNQKRSFRFPYNHRTVDGYRSGLWKRSMFFPLHHRKPWHILHRVFQTCLYHTFHIKEEWFHSQNQTWNDIPLTVQTLQVWNHTAHHCRRIRNLSDGMAACLLHVIPWWQGEQNQQHSHQQFQFWMNPDLYQKELSVLLQMLSDQSLDQLIRVNHT